MKNRLQSLRGRDLLNTIAFSRHSALGTARTLSPTRAASFATQLLWLVSGACLIGFAVALLVEAQFGLAPYDVLSSGLSNHLGISLGQAGWLLAAALFAAATILRRPPSPWGVAYIFLNGVAIDAASTILRTPESTALRVVFVIAGILIMATGITVVVHSGTTGGPFELLMAAGADRGVSPIRIRYMLDAGVFGLGLVLGGTAGLGTVAFAATMGLCLSAIGQAVEDYKCGRQVRRTLESDASRDSTVEIPVRKLVS